MASSGYNNNLLGRFHSDVRTAEDWLEYIDHGRNHWKRTIANNTIVYREDGGIGIKLHATTIVFVDHNGTMRLDSGGWLTSTTKERLNRYTNAGIWQKNGVWYLKDGSLFYDGMTIDFDGTPHKPKKPAEYEAQLKQIKKAAKKYAKDFVNALQDGLIDYPNGGDCWACLFAGKNNSAGKDQPMGTDHLWQHMREHYFVPSLLVNAGRAAGYRDDQIGLMGIGGHRLFIEPDRVIYKYIVRQLQGAIS